METWDQLTEVEQTDFMLSAFDMDPKEVGDFGLLCDTKLTVPELITYSTYLATYVTDRISIPTHHKNYSNAFYVGVSNVPISVRRRFLWYVHTGLSL